MVRILLIAAALALALHLLGRFKRLDGKRRKRVGQGALGVLVAVALIAILARFGLHWVGVVAAATWGAVRTLAPLALRLLPLFGQPRPNRDERPHETPRPDSEPAPGPDPASPHGSMTRAQALEVLNVKEGASREEILASYKNLMRKVHPDTPFGSTFLASQVNQARDVLLG